MFQFFGVTGTYEGSGGGSINIVNGIIKQYKASTGTISANTFVEFVNDILLENTPSSYVHPSATLIDTNKIFLAYRNNMDLYVTICTISNATITIGTSTKISSKTATAGIPFFVISVETNKVFIAYNGGGNLYGIVCTISGTTITKGSEKQLTTVSGSSSKLAITLCGTNKIFVVHNNNSYLYGMICEISGRTITAGTDTQLTTTADSTTTYEAYPKILNTNENVVFIAHKQGNYLYGIVCEISGRTITAGTDTQLSSQSNSYYYISAVLIDTNKVFIAHRYSSYLYGMICEISGTTITVGTDTQLITHSVSITSYEYTSAILIDTNKVFISHSKYSLLHGIVCEISGTTITAGIDTQLSSESDSGNYTLSVLIDTNKVFISHSNESELNAVLIRIDGNNITKMGNIISSSSKIDGLLVTEATTSTAGDVWVLNN